MIVHVRVHALVSLAASAAWPDEKREPNRRQTTHRQVSFIDIDNITFVYGTLYNYSLYNTMLYALFLVTCHVYVTSDIMCTVNM